MNEVTENIKSIRTTVKIEDGYIRLFADCDEDIKGATLMINNHPVPQFIPHSSKTAVMSRVLISEQDDYTQGISLTVENARAMVDKLNKAIDGLSENL